jgi:hypothetical protein
MRVPVALLSFSLFGCGASETPATEDAGATGDVATETAMDVDSAVVKRPIDAVLTDYIAAWSEADATKRNAKLAASVAKDVYYADLTPVKTTTLADLSKHMGAQITKYRGVRMKKLSGPDLHHERMRFLWARTDTTDAPIADGLDYMEVGPDGKFTRIVGHFDPVPPAPMLEPVMKSFVAAFTTSDVAKRRELLTASLAGAYIDPAAGALDIAALAMKIDPSVALNVDGFSEHEGGFRLAYTHGATKGVFLGRRNASALIAEVSAFEGDPPKP